MDHKFNIVVLSMCHIGSVCHYCLLSTNVIQDFIVGFFFFGVTWENDESNRQTAAKKKFASISIVLFATIYMIFPFLSLCNYYFHDNWNQCQKHSLSIKEKVYILIVENERVFRLLIRSNKRTTQKKTILKHKCRLFIVLFTPNELTVFNILKTIRRWFK